MMKKSIFLLTTLFILVFSASITVYAQPKTMEDGTVFDAEYYANTYADVKEAFGNDEVALYNHYVQHGKAEGRLACAPSNVEPVASAKTLIDNFDAVYYAKNNPDVVSVLGNDANVLYQHYLDHGKSEGRMPNSQATSVKTSTSVSNKETQVNNKSSSGVVVPTHDESAGNLVWVPTQGGTKYHNKSTCSKMENPMHVSMETARENGYTACKKCYK